MLRLKGMTVKGVADGIVRLIKKGDSMSKGVGVREHQDSLSADNELHISLNMDNISAVCSSISAKYAIMLKGLPAFR
jgi:hypothetical protein